MSNSFFESNSVYTTPVAPLGSDYFMYDRYLPPQGSPNDNPFYVCFLSCPDKGFTIKANLPQEYALELGGVFESPFSQSLTEKTGPVAKTAGSAGGFQFATKAMTARLWQASNDVTFTLPFVLQLETDYFKDILEPISNLYKLILPEQSATAGLLTSPGPSLDLVKLKEAASELMFGNSSTQTMTSGSAPVNSGNSPSVPDPTAALLNSIKNNCFLYIGSYQFFDSVVVTNIAQNTKVLPYHLTGTMTRVEVAVTFSTFCVPTQADIPNLLLGSTGLGGSLYTPNTGSTPGSASSSLTPSSLLPPASGSNSAQYANQLANSGVF